MFVICYTSTPTFFCFFFDVIFLKIFFFICVARYKPQTTPVPNTINISIRFVLSYLYRYPLAIIMDINMCLGTHRCCHAFILRFVPPLPSYSIFFYTSHAFHVKISRHDTPDTMFVNY